MTEHTANVHLCTAAAERAAWQALLSATRTPVRAARRRSLFAWLFK